MKRFKSLSLKKRALAIAGVSVLCLVVVGTIAYNQDSFFFNNLFKLGDDFVEFVETFDSPDDWQPCQEIDKTAIATNKNATPRYVRMKINEYWRTKDTTTPSTDHETTDLPLTWNDSGTDKHYAVINTQNDDKWELKNDGWYYYKTTLAQNESTLSLLKSVTFNCEVNTAGEIRYSADGKVGESVPTEYADATYHLYITFQMSDEEFAPGKHIADCDNPTELYDIIACQTLGPDDTATFGTEAPFDDTRVGVNTYAPTKDDNYPVYYYRSSSTKNYVDFANKCWQVLRTTGTGGVKLLYKGPGSITTIDNPDGTTTERRICYGYSELSGKFNTVPDPDDYTDNRLKFAGYMYGTTNNVQHEDENNSYVRQFFNNSNPSDPSHPRVLFANDVTWDGNKYALTGDMVEVNVWQGNYSNPPESSYQDIMRGHRYTCRSMTTECEQVEYMMVVSSTTDTSHSITLSNGDTVEDFKNQIFANTYNSEIKQTIDGWYATALGSYTSKLEDTVYCADRNITGGGLSGKDFLQEDTGGVTPYSQYRAYSSTYMRNYYDHSDMTANAKPNLNCRKQDSFTVSQSNGNGALTYPVGLPSVDEVILTYNGSNSAISSYPYWTSSFAMASGGSGPNVWNFAINNSVIERADIGSNKMINPVISLKPGTKVVSGTGDVLNAPYKIEEN